ncbi:predicted thioesterase [Eggerthella sp. CAG:368]|nr:predicted thioesterase [Eggerthella sp. CAG:368]
MPKPTKITVRYAETDRMGVVYHANYLVWFDVARTEFLQELGFPYDKIEEQGYMAPVLEAHVNYGQSFTFGDTALIIVSITKLTPVKVKYSYKVYKEGDDLKGKPRLTGYTMHCLVCSDTFKPVSQKKVMPALFSVYQKLLKEE